MEPCEIDECLLNRRLRQYVMFTGLDLANNPHHAAVHAEFVVESRAGSLPIRYGFLTPDHELFRRPSTVPSGGGGPPEKNSASSPGSHHSHPSPLAPMQPGGLAGTTPALRKVDGILKRGWPLKYLRQRPALIVCFVDVDWDEASWPDKKTECESKINSLRQSLGARDTRLALVLVPRAAASSAPSPAHSVIAEKKLELCAHCKLPTKNLFVLPPALSALKLIPVLSYYALNGLGVYAVLSRCLLGETAVGSGASAGSLPRAFSEAVTRCEAAFHDIAQEAYLIFLKRIRARHLPNNDPRLLVRQQYKLAFISELRQDTHSALRYYKTAYQNIAELEAPEIANTSSDAYELAAVAGLLNFKVCELSFALNSANDAIAHFHRHQKAFFQRPAGTCPSRELAAIESAWWRSQQCRLFAELFERAVTGGLAAFAFQNPGRFLEESALAYQHANALIRQLRERITSARASPASGGEGADAAPAIDITGAHTTFYGQRPWRDVTNVGTPVAVATGSGSAAVAAQLTEHAAKLALEQSVRENYQRSLQLWSMAVTQFKRYACDGAHNTALIHMADDYVQLHKLGTALQLLHRVAGEFYARNLRCLLRGVLLKYLRIAYCMVNLNEYVWALVQLLNPALQSPGTIVEDDALSAVEESSREFIARHFAVAPAAPQIVAASDGLSASTFTLAATQWLQYYNHSVQVCFSVELNRLDAFLQCRARFLHAAEGDIHTGDSLPIEVEVRNISRLPIAFNKCTLTLEEMSAPNGKTATALLESDGAPGVALPGGAVRALHFFHRPHVDGVSVKEKQILIRKVSLRVVGSEPATADSKANASFDFDMSGEAPARTSAWVSEWSVMARTARVVPRRRNLCLVGPEVPIRLLVDEVVDVPFSLTNHELVALKRIKIIGHQIYKEDATSDSVFVPAYIQDVSEPLAPGETFRLDVRLSSKSKNCVGLQTQVTCQIDVDDEVGARASSVPLSGSDRTSSASPPTVEGAECTQRFDVDCAEPFSSSVAVYAINSDRLAALARGQCVTLEATVAVQRSIRLQSIDWNLSAELTSLDSVGGGAGADGTRAAEGNGGLTQAFDVAPGERFQRRLRVQVAPTAGDGSTSLALGDFVVEWRSPAGVETVRNVINLGQLPVISVPLIVEARVTANTDADTAANGDGPATFVAPALAVRRPFLIDYRLRNAADAVLPLSVALDYSDAFIFAGLTEFCVQLLPGETYGLRVLATALSVGQLPFPRLNVRDGDALAAAPDGRKVGALAHNSLPATLYVLVRFCVNSISQF